MAPRCFSGIGGETSIATTTHPDATAEATSADAHAAEAEAAAYEAEIKDSEAEAAAEVEGADNAEAAVEEEGVGIDDAEAEATAEYEAPREEAAAEVSSTSSPQSHAAAAEASAAAAASAAGPAQSQFAFLKEYRQQDLSREDKVLNLFLNKSISSHELETHTAALASYFQDSLPEVVKFISRTFNVNLTSWDELVQMLSRALTSYELKPDDRFTLSGILSLIQEGQLAGNTESTESSKLKATKKRNRKK